MQICLSENADADFRAAQCKARNTYDERNGAYEWVPAAEGESKSLIGIYHVLV